MSKTISPKNYAHYNYKLIASLIPDLKVFRTYTRLIGGEERPQIHIVKMVERENFCILSFGDDTEGEKSPFPLSDLILLINYKEENVKIIATGGEVILDTDSERLNNLQFVLYLWLERVANNYIERKLYY